MTGSNTEMQIVKVLQSGMDGTDASLTSYGWLCPKVTPYSKIYFYQVSLYYRLRLRLTADMYRVHKLWRNPNLPMDDTLYSRCISRQKTSTLTTLLRFHRLLAKRSFHCMSPSPTAIRYLGAKESSQMISLQA